MQVLTIALDPVKGIMQILTNDALLTRGIPGSINRRFFELPFPDQRPYPSFLSGRCRCRKAFVAIVVPGV
jgi:hypothetical protein